MLKQGSREDRVGKPREQLLAWIDHAVRLDHQWAAIRDRHRARWQGNQVAS
jgi:hypothetical protein